jgi:hypothetical protein
LKLKCYEPLSNFAFKFNLRRYTEEVQTGYTFNGQPMVGRCRLTASTPELNARLVSEFSLETEL